MPQNREGERNEEGMQNDEEKRGGFIRSITKEYFGEDI
jgi:hypothetical protein